MNMIRFLAVGAMAFSVVATAVPTVGFAQEFRDREYHRGSDRDRDRDGYGRGGCSPREAIRQARARGMYDTQIVSIDSRKIVVDGYGKRNEYTKLVLANRRGCPRMG